jgi:hypothetical protein
MRWSSVLSPFKVWYLRDLLLSDALGLESTLQGKPQTGSGLPVNCNKLVRSCPHFLFSRLLELPAIIEAISL